MILIDKRVLAIQTETIYIEITTKIARFFIWLRNDKMIGEKK